jgi:hydrogenase maturation protease
MTSARPRVIGIGNPDRGDDAAGRLVARALCAHLGDDVEILEHGGEATGLLERLEGAEVAVIVDAAVSGAAPGTIRRFDARAAPLPQTLSDLSTHGFGLAGAIELARALGELPRCCVVYAIEGGSFEPGARPSPEVEAAVQEVAGLIAGELGSSRIHAHGSEASDA